MGYQECIKSVPCYARCNACMGYPRRGARSGFMGLSSMHGVSTMADLFTPEDMKYIFGPATCNARTRSGGRCKNAQIGLTGRCRMHGGKSLCGESSPRYKHG